MHGGRWWFAHSFRSLALQSALVATEMALSRYLVERLTPDFGFYLRADELLAQTQSEWQRIEVFDNALFGRVMRIDDCFMTSERDEFFLP